MLKQALKGINHPVLLKDHGQSKSTYDLIYGDEPCKLHKAGGGAKKKIWVGMAQVFACPNRLGIC